MAVTLPYSSLETFTALTVHSYTTHNLPHSQLLANDNALKAAIDSLQTSVTSLESSGRIVSTYLGLESGALIWNDGRYYRQASKNYSYTYSGSYVPLFLNVTFRCNGSGNSVLRGQARWLNSVGGVIQTWIEVAALNALGSGDGGAGLNDDFNATLPFLVGTKTIELQDFNYNYRMAFSIHTLTEHQIARWAEWGY